MGEIRKQSLFRESVRFLGRNRLLLILLFVIFILRIPTLFEPHRYADEEIYLTLGQGVRKGLVLYRDIHDNKPPFLYLVAAVAHSLFWFRFILLVVHAAGVIFFWKLAELVFDKKHWAVVVSTGFFGLLSTLPFLEGNIANGENFMIVPALFGTYLLYRSLADPSERQRTLPYLVIGLLFSFAFLFKVSIAFDFVGLLAFWWLLAEPKLQVRDRLRLLFSRRLWLVVAGFIGPIAISIAYYTLRGAFVPYVRSALLQNIGYLSTWGNESDGILSNPLIWRGLAVAGVFGAVWALKEKLSFPVRFVVVWTAFSLYGAFLSSRPYPHYLLEPLVPVSLLVVLVFTQTHIVHRFVSLAMLGLVVLGYFQNSFWYYSTLPYYQNFMSFVAGSKSREAYLDFWGVKHNYEVADYLKKRTSSSDRIFVWGTEPSIYALSDRLPVGRYTVSYHIVDFDAFDETGAALRTTPPKYIVVVQNLEDFSELNSLLKQRYIHEIDFDGIAVFRLIPKA